MWTSGYNLNQLDRFFLYMRKRKAGAILGGTLLEFAMKVIGILALAFRRGDRVRIRQSASRRSRSHHFPAVRNRCGSDRPGAGRACPPAFARCKKVNPPPALSDIGALLCLISILLVPLAIAGLSLDQHRSWPIAKCLTPDALLALRYCRGRPRVLCFRFCLAGIPRRDSIRVFPRRAEDGIGSHRDRSFCEESTSMALRHLSPLYWE